MLAAPADLMVPQWHRKVKTGAIVAPRCSLKSVRM